MLDLLIGKMLMNALKTLVKNPVKESFYGKRKKNILTNLSFYYISFYIF